MAPLGIFQLQNLAINAIKNAENRCINRFSVLNAFHLIADLVHGGLCHGDVITLFPVPVLLTAQNSPNSFAQVTDRQSLSAADVLLVQVIPSAEVITLFPVPLLLTAQNSPNSFAHVTDSH
jgi:hypothetical protein